MSSLTAPIPPDHSPACRAENTVRYTVPLTVTEVSQPMVRDWISELPFRVFLLVIFWSDPVSMLRAGKWGRSCRVGGLGGFGGLHQLSIG
jgi:hypothetical protein